MGVMSATGHTTLLPCPFCGDTHLSTMQMTSFDETPERKWERVKCDTCGAMAPTPTWNSRANGVDEKRVALLANLQAHIKDYSQDTGAWSEYISLDHCSTLDLLVQAQELLSDEVTP